MDLGAVFEYIKNQLNAGPRNQSFVLHVRDRQIVEVVPTGHIKCETDLRAQTAQLKKVNK